ncbi:hypothetical protein L873DRAFT_1723557, partial [Choiromyces venosus 120613-1]
EQGCSVGALALREMIDPNGDYHGVDFLYHVLQAKELSLRLEREQGHWHGGITRKITHDMIAAELWMRNLEAKATNGKYEYAILSYWRSRSIIGRVLAVVPDIHEICGWVGPCESPTGLETYRTPAALVQVHTRAPAFKLQDSAGEQQPFVPSDGRLTWEEPILPPVSEEVCVLRKLRVLSVPADVNSADPGGVVTAYRAKLDFYLLRANKVITLTLYSNSIFVAAPPCKGTHKIDPKSTSIYTRTIYEVSRLDKAELKTEGVTVINATGHGGQALARAWCAEKGTNAVVWKRDRECCFKCGLMVAGKEGLDVDVLILC